MSELRDRILAQQAGPPPTVAEISEALYGAIMAHDEHEWEQIGRCVYCHPCGVRLYQGTIPEGHKRYDGRAVLRAEDARRANEMRKRWGKDG